MKKKIIFLLFCIGVFINLKCFAYYEPEVDKYAYEDEISNECFNELQKEFITLFQRKNIGGIIIPTKAIKFNYPSEVEGVFDIYFDLVNGDRFLLYGNESIKGNLSYMMAFNNIFGSGYSILYYNLTNLKIIDSADFCFPNVDLRTMTLGIPFRPELNKNPDFDLEYPYTNISFNMNLYADNIKNSSNISISNRFGNVVSNEELLISANAGKIVNFEFEWFNGTNINTDYNPMISGILLDAKDFIEKYNLNPLDTTPPTFTSNDNYISNVSSPLSREYILSTIKASDETDGVCSPYIKETNYVPNVLGKYYMIIGAKDKSGNEGTKNIWINVVDIDAPTASVKVFNAVNTTKSSVDDIIAKSITASDNYFTSFKYSVLSDNYSANYKVAGNYEIKVRITENRDNGLYVDKTIRVENADKLAPTFVTKPEVINAINNKLLTTNEIIAKFKATDESSNVAYSLVGYENYKNNYGKAGTYNLGIKATDTSGNSTEFNFNIINADGIAPTITGDGRMEVSYTKKLSIDDIIKTLKASDESATNLVIKVVADNYSSVYDTLGEHQITFKTNDGVNDSPIFTKTIVVIDDVNPVLVGPEKIEISNKEIDQLTEDEIKQKFSATDKSNVALSLIDTNNYLTNKGKVGEYNFTITATDSSNNKSSISFQIKVSDEIAPVLSINDSSYVIVLQEGESLTIEQIKNILGQIGAIENVEEIENIESAYFETYSAGEYECKIQMKSGEVYNIKIKANKNQKKNKASFIDKILAFLISIWIKLLEWLFKLIRK